MKTIINLQKGSNKSERDLVAEFLGEGNVLNFAMVCSGAEIYSYDEKTGEIERLDGPR